MSLLTVLVGLKWIPPLQSHLLYIGIGLIDRMETLNGLIGKIPSNPLWAELLSSQMKETREKHTARSVSRSTTAMSANTSAATHGTNADKKRESSQAMGKTRSAPARQGGAVMEGGRAMEGRRAEGVV